MKKIAIIGAGISGVFLAHKLNKYFSVEVFEKSRGIGGRMATKRTDTHYFNHGVKFFSANSRSFNALIQHLLAQNVVVNNTAKHVIFDNDTLTYQNSQSSTLYCGTPQMNSIVKHFAKNLNIHLNTQISSITKDKQYWQLTDILGNKYLGFDWIIITTPPAQATALLPHDFKYYSQISKIIMQPCLSLLLGFNENLNLNFTSALIINNKVIEKITVQNHNLYTSLVADATPHYSCDKLNSDPTKTTSEMCDYISKIINKTANDAQYKHLHTWRYAYTSNSHSTTTTIPLIDKKLHIGVCGDWCYGNQVEDAITSANNIFQQLIKLLLHNKKMLTNTQQPSLSEIIQLAWCDKTSFEDICVATNLPEQRVKKIMQKNLKSSSYKVWRKRVSGRRSKHCRKYKENPA